MYSIIRTIGNGAHGTVHEGECLFPSMEVNGIKKKVAIKEIFLTEKKKEKLLREVAILSKLKHENIIKLIDLQHSEHTVRLVMEFMPSSLSELIQNLMRPLLESEIKYIMQMILNGVKYLHDHLILHRDLKPANILIDGNGKIKIADFGLSKDTSAPDQSINTNNMDMLHHDHVVGSYDDDLDHVRPHTHQVATRWYRAPELLFGSRHYDGSIDIWAVGCIFGELWNRCPLFPGQNDIDQVSQVFRLLGTPTFEAWPDFQSLPDYEKLLFDDMPKQAWECIVPDASKTAIQLISTLLVYSPSQRLTAKKALESDFFTTKPKPKLIPLPPYQVKKVELDFTKTSSILPHLMDLKKSLINMSAMI